MYRKRISLLVSAVFLWVQLFGCFQSAFAQESKERSAVAVADLDATGVTNQERIVLSDRLRAEIWKTQVFDMLERQAMDALLSEQGFQLSGACDQASCLLEIGKMLPVEKIIGGSVGKIGNTWTVTLRMIDIGSGRIEKTVTKDCPNCTIDEILSPLLSYAALDLAGVEIENERTLGRAQPASADARPEGFDSNAKLAMQGVSKGGGSIFGKWWFWGIIAAGGGAAAALSGMPADPGPLGAGDTGSGSIRITW